MFDGVVMSFKFKFYPLKQPYFVEVKSRSLSNVLKDNSSQFL